MKRPIITLEDGVEVLETTGDVDAFEHGGGVLFRAPDRRDIFWTFWSARELGQKFYRVFTAPIPKDIVQFFDPDLDELRIVSGLQKKDILSLSRSKNPSDRLELVMIIQECSGPSRVDPSHEPELLSAYDLSARWGPVFGIDVKNVPKLDYEDFILRETDQGYECGSVDGRYLGRFSKYEMALCAIADGMRKFTRETSNVFHEHSEGQLELLVWDPRSFVGKLPARRGKLSGTRWRNAMKRYLRSELSKTPSRSEVFRGRRRAQGKINQIDRLERAMEIRRSFEEI